MASPLEGQTDPPAAGSPSRNSVELPLLREAQVRFPLLCAGDSYPKSPLTQNLLSVYSWSLMAVSSQSWLFPFSEDMKGACHNLIYIMVSCFFIFLVDYKQFQGRNDLCFNSEIFECSTDSGKL